MNYGKEDPVFKLVHTRMKLYLNHQEELMEQRIKYVFLSRHNLILVVLVIPILRKFEEQQREQLAKLQEHAHEERRKLFV